MKAMSRIRIGGAAVSVLAFCLVGVASSPALAQLLYSFESITPVLDGWTASSATIVPSTTFGVTDGTKSMLIDNLTSSVKNDVGFSTTGSGNDYGYWNDAAHAIEAGKTNVKLEFDFSWDVTNVTGPAAYAQLGMFVNSTGAGFKQ